MASKVVVHDVGSLSNYAGRLAELKRNIEEAAKKLVAEADALKVTIDAMNGATASQAGNWQDPQYERLKEMIEPCVKAATNTVTSVKNTAGTIGSQMQSIDSSISYIKSLASKLSNI